MLAQAGAEVRSDSFNVSVTIDNDNDDFKADGFAGIEIMTGQVYHVIINDIGGNYCN